ncbi:MAG: hypothetical protein V4805_18445 [Pseudomonadota bacterium]
MQLDKLQLDLRPRPNAHALDLGFALLRANAGHVYGAWLALWLPLVALAGGLALLFPTIESGWFLLLAWWLRPMLERAPLYVLSRQVFGEKISWQAALRAWPRQLGGGWFRMLTWGRPFSAGRALYYAIWQLEGARGKVARERRRVIGRDGAANSAVWFGVACAHFEGVLYFGTLAFIGIFISDSDVVNPFAIFVDDQFTDGNHLLTTLVTIGCYAIGEGIIGPIYTACCFTLYLNRRATLEAWDIEIMLRQIKAPQAQRSQPQGAKLAAAAWVTLGLSALLAFGLGASSPSVEAAPMAATNSNSLATNLDKCEKPDWAVEHTQVKPPPQTPQQAQLRQEVTKIFEADDLRSYYCEESWRWKVPPKKPPKTKIDPSWKKALAVMANILKFVLIAAALGFVGWLLYRYRSHFGPFARKPRPQLATEIGGLDIRPETLPDDVAASVRQLWSKGEQRAALALLYRATLSRLVDQDQLVLTQGATEGDCLRLAKRALAQGQLSARRLDVTVTTTDLWLNAAYGNRWPLTANVLDSCAAWHAQFGSVKTVAGVKA